MIRRPATRPGTLKYVSFGFRGNDDGEAMLLLPALTLASRSAPRRQTALYGNEVWVTRI